jgi:hypothetical protein
MLMVFQREKLMPENGGGIREANVGKKKKNSEREASKIPAVRLTASTTLRHRISPKVVGNHGELNTHPSLKMSRP